MSKDLDLKLLFSVPVIVAALGYFVDIYDLLLFSIVRVPSLVALGVSADQLLEQGEHLITVQMGGLLIGGLVWGIMGDKHGRLSVLFGSILIYSLANIGNGFASTVGQYAILRFIAGVGLAGELGAGITLVSEILPTRLRGYGTAIVATVGLFGAVLANFVAKSFDWQIAYFIGGGLGILLLITRISVMESGIFLKVKLENVKRGNLLQLFSKWSRVKMYVGSVLIGLPIWFVIGVLITFSPEFADAMGLKGIMDDPQVRSQIAGNAVMWSYIGLAVGDLSSGVASQWAKSRKKIVLLFILLTLAFVSVYLYVPVTTTFGFYVKCFLLGVGVGYWALFVTIAAEQFGTNLRSTVATTVPNFIRGAVIPLVWSFKYLRAEYGMITGALIVTVVTVVVACIALLFVEETYSKDLNFLEED